MGKFDFREMFGGGAQAVPKDDALADGVKPTGEVDGMHAHLIAKRAGVAFLVDNLAGHLCANANVNGLCAQGLAALLIARLGQKAIRELPDEDGKGQRQHLIDEVQAVLDAMRRGEA
jgi:hypothetical protein